MAFCVVQTRKTKRSLPCMSVVPATWVEDKCVFWPPNDIISLSKKEDSWPDETIWRKQKCKVLGRARTFQQAEELMNVLEKVTDSEDAAQMGHGTRAKPAKKQVKFKSKKYNLAAPSVEADAVTPSAIQSGQSNAASIHGIVPQPDIGTVVSNTVESGRTNLAVESNAAKSIRILSVTSTHPTVNPTASVSALPQAAISVFNTGQLPHLGTPTTVQANPVYQVDASVSGSSVSQQITVPVVLGSDGKQYAKLANGSYYEFAETIYDPVEQPEETVIKQDEVDLEADDDLVVVNCPKPPLDDFASELHKLNNRLDVYEAQVSLLVTEVRKVNERLDVQEGLLVKITEFMANFNKLLSMRNPTATPTVIRQEEDFSEYENMPKIDSDQSFKAFEHSLADSKFSEKFIRYLHSVYSLNGKRDSGSLFRTLIRKMIMPNVFIPYSWMGNKRKRKGSGDSGQNINFQETFPNFIKLINHVLQAADCSSTREQNDKLFKNLLRYKNLELKRFENGGGEHRASSSRKRHKRQKLEVRAVPVQTIDSTSIVASSPPPTPSVDPPYTDPVRNSERYTADESENENASSSESDGSETEDETDNESDQSAESDE